ncbi:hypothetical protein SALBM311S_10671 [Streptomyces alboniger]
MTDCARPRAVGGGAGCGQDAQRIRAAQNAAALGGHSRRIAAGRGDRSGRTGCRSAGRAVRGAVGSLGAGGGVAGADACRPGLGPTRRVQRGSRRTRSAPHRMVRRVAARAIRRPRCRLGRRRVGDRPRLGDPYRRACPACVAGAVPGVPHGPARRDTGPAYGRRPKPRRSRSLAGAHRSRHGTRRSARRVRRVPGSGPRGGSASHGTARPRGAVPGAEVVRLAHGDVCVRRVGRRRGS